MRRNNIYVGGRGGWVEEWVVEWLVGKGVKGMEVERWDDWVIGMKEEETRGGVMLWCGMYGRIG